MHDSDNVVPLTALHAGESARVVAVRGGLARQTRLASMGLTVGGEVRVTHRAVRGPMILQVRGARIALGRGVAASIHVSPFSPPPEAGK